MQDSMDLVDLKLLKVEAAMKTEPGRRMAKERTKQLRVFQEWWNEDMKMGTLWASPDVLESESVFSSFQGSDSSDSRDA